MPDLIETSWPLDSSVWHLEHNAPCSLVIPSVIWPRSLGILLSSVLKRGYGQETRLDRWPVSRGCWEYLQSSGMDLNVPLCWAITVKNDHAFPLHQPCIFSFRSDSLQANRPRVPCIPWLFLRRVYLSAGVYLKLRSGVSKADVLVWTGGLQASRYTTYLTQEDNQWKIMQNHIYRTTATPLIVGGFIIDRTEDRDVH